MSHWVIMPLGTVDDELEAAWEDRHLSKEQWVRQVGDRIEKRGNLNPGNAGFVILNEHPDSNQKLSAIIVPRSVDWVVHEAVMNCDALKQAEKTLGQETVEQIRESAFRDIRTDLVLQARDKALEFLEKALDCDEHGVAPAGTVSRSPSIAMLKDEMADGTALTSDDVRVVRDLLAVAVEHATPIQFSGLQLFVEDRLELILKGNIHLDAFRSLPAGKQDAARTWVINSLGWERFYLANPEDAQPALRFPSS